MAQTNYLNAIDALGVLEGSYDGATSAQLLAADLKLAKAAGSSTAGSPAYLAPVMGNVKEVTAGDGLTATKNIIAGGIFKIDITGTISSQYEAGAAIAERGDKAIGAAGALVVALGGDSGEALHTGAFIRAAWWNSTPTTSIQYGIDLEGVAHTEYALLPRYAKAPLRLGGRYSNAGTLETVNDLLLLFGTAAPTNGASGTGAGDAGAGSIYIRQSASNSKIYINGNTKASPTWNLVTSA